MGDKSLEQVLVIPTALAQKLAPKSFNMPSATNQESIIKVILDNHSFREREEAEKNYDFKQVIPYVVLSHTGRYLLTQRTSQQQEKRLHNLFSIGQGGHVNDLDFGTPTTSPIIAGMLREVREEFHLDDDLENRWLAGIINDNSTDVGKVHLGLMFAISLKVEQFSVAETGKHIARWASVKELSEHYDAMEPWSKILMDQWLAVGTA